jgi:hypothetical protein
MRAEPEVVVPFEGLVRAPARLWRYGRESAGDARPAFGRPPVAGHADGQEEVQRLVPDDPGAITPRV